MKWLIVGVTGKSLEKKIALKKTSKKTFRENQPEAQTKKCPHGIYLGEIRKNCSLLNDFLPIMLCH